LKKNIIVTVNVFCYKKCQQGSVDPDLHVWCNPLFCF
jgi:hypothetical protein